jgi:hypothetical protein
MKENFCSASITFGLKLNCLYFWLTLVHNEELHDEYTPHSILRVVVVA